MAHDVIILPVVRHRDPPLVQRVQDDLTNVEFFTARLRKKRAKEFCRKTYVEHVERFLAEAHRTLHRCKEFDEFSIEGCQQSACEILQHHNALKNLLREDGDDEACRRVAKVLELIDKIAEQLIHLARGAVLEKVTGLVEVYESYVYSQLYQLVTPAALTAPAS